MTIEQVSHTMFISGTFQKKKKPNQKMWKKRRFEMCARMQSAEPEH